MNAKLLIFIACAATVGIVRPSAADTGATCEFLMVMETTGVSRAGAPQAPRTMRINGNAWLSAGKARVDMTPAGRPGHTLIITPKEIFTLQPSRMNGTVKPMTAELKEKMFGGFPLLFLTPLEPTKKWKDARRVKAENVNGTTCDVWKVNLASGPGQVAWIWLPRTSGPAYPLKAEISVPTPRYANGKLTNDGPPLKCSVRAFNVKRETSIAASQFAVPTAYSVQPVAADAK